MLARRAAEWRAGVPVTWAFGQLGSTHVVACRNPVGRVEDLLLTRRIGARTTSPFGKADVEGRKMNEQEPVKGIYQHYKGGFYEVLGVADDPTREGRWVV